MSNASCCIGLHVCYVIVGRIKYKVMILRLQWLSDWLKTIVIKFHFFWCKYLFRGWKITSTFVHIWSSDTPSLSQPWVPSGWKPGTIILLHHDRLWLPTSNHPNERVGWLGPSSRAVYHGVTVSLRRAVDGVTSLSAAGGNQTHVKLLVLW